MAKISYFMAKILQSLDKSAKFIYFKNPFFFIYFIYHSGV